MLVPRALAPLALLLALLAACSAPEAQAPATNGEGAPGGPRVLATVAMIGDVARAVAGEHATVEVLIGEGTDPHTYTASRGDVARLLAADVILYNGLHLEGRMASDLEGLASTKAVVPVAERIPRELLLEADGEHDPHVWMDPARWAHVADVVAEVLSESDPANAQAYAANASAYRAELARLDAAARAAVDTIPEGQRVLVTAHDAFSYLGDTYGIEVLAVQGLSTESEAGLADINALVDTIVGRRIPAVFVETSVAEKNVRALVEGARARGHEVAVGGSLFSDAMGAPGTREGTYVGMIDHNVSTIVRALGGHVPEGGLMSP
jgi:manganese/zinc/iron transport system substrate-binding protein